MSLADLGIIGDCGEEEKSGLTLLIDGDLVIYPICEKYNEDDDESREKIVKAIHQKVDSILSDSGCDKYIMFVTTKFNFRHFLVDDYKANRLNTKRPVNLAWAKRYCIEKINTYYHKYLEADDLLGIYSSDLTVIWSTDKDLRQIPKRHLDDATRKIIHVSEEGDLYLDKWVNEKGVKKEKVFFSGKIGFYYQLLIGDSADYIVGCGVRQEATRKTGANKGETYLRRKGVGPKEALQILHSAALNADEGTTPLEAALEAVKKEYIKLHGRHWQEKLETQANLLYMVRELHGNVIKRWTYDGRDEYFCLDKGVILDEDYTPTKCEGHSGT